MKKFDIPSQYKSNFIKEFKQKRKVEDPRKKDFSPTVISFEGLEMIYARHFGFCYGVENAIEISYKAIRENPGKRIYLLSQMIHNPHVNNDLQENGVSFITDTYGEQLTPWEEITSQDIVIIPAFGTTFEIENKLEKIGVNIAKYNTTCPFVEKVWKTSKKLGDKNYTVIIHGKHLHEETRATFSQSSRYSSSVVIKDIKEAKKLGAIIKGEIEASEFFNMFEGRYSKDFDPIKDFVKVGVVNQTTMLASETSEIANYFKELMIEKYGQENYKEHFADTRDTLCYATNDNQKSTIELLNQEADIAIVVGGFNSSNTTHLVELCLKRFPTFFISSKEDIVSSDVIKHYDITSKKIVETNDYFPSRLSDGQATRKTKIIMTSGASCPDSIMQEVTDRILEVHGV